MAKDSAVANTEQEVASFLGWWSSHGSGVQCTITLAQALWIKALLSLIKVLELSGDELMTCQYYKVGRLSQKKLPEEVAA